MAIMASPMQWAQTQTPDDLWPHLHAGMGGVSGSARCRSWVCALPQTNCV